MHCKAIVHTFWVYIYYTYEYIWLYVAIYTYYSMNIYVTFANIEYKHIYGYNIYVYSI